MKISCNWIREYANTGLSAGEIAEILTSTGLEVETVESWESIRGNLKGVVTGKVISCVKHPDADKLSVCRVDIAEDEPLNIVCGAPNVAVGQKVLVATIGAVLYPTGSEEPFEIKKAKIRGVVSEGMICAEDELGVGSSHDGIMILGDAIPPGLAASEYFGTESDQVLEVGLTPNRSDAMSHMGVARDLLAALSFRQKKRFPLTIPQAPEPLVANATLPVKVIMENKEACRRYTGMTIEGVTVAPSPDWLKHRLRAVGIKPINNVVDITNFVMQETGHPLHAFDYDKLSDGTIVVKNLPEGTLFTTLDGVERKLLGSDMMICDSTTPLCIAGVYGGIHSGVTAQTRNLFIESAWFDPVSVRKSARAHQLNTDASFRFERGADPTITPYALFRAVNLICEIAGGKPASKISDEGDWAGNPPLPIVDIRLERINQVAGVDITPEEITKILQSLDIKVVKQTPDSLHVIVPGYRADVSREIDVIEEVLRIYGLDNIPVPDAIPVAFPVGIKNPKERLQQIFSRQLVANGFFEAWNNSLSSSRTQVIPDDLTGQLLPVSVLNPLSTDLDTLRTGLLPGLLENIRHNIHRQMADIRLFESGYAYFAKAESSPPDAPVQNRFVETPLFALAITGKFNRESWRQKQYDADLYDLKSLVDALLSLTGIQEEAISVSPAGDRRFLSGAKIQAGYRVIGRFGQVHPDALKVYQVKQPVFYAEFNLEEMIPMLAEGKTMTLLPKFPEVRRDLSLVIDKHIDYTRIREIVLKTDRLIRRVNLFDVFSSDTLPPGKISYAVSLILRHDEKTLSEGEIDKVMARVLKNLTNETGAVLR